MFELPEVVVLAGQIDQTLRGKRIRSGELGNSPHKFVWYNRTHAEFAKLVGGKEVGEAKVMGRWLSIAVDPGYVLLMGEFGGKLRYHPDESTLPEKYHLLLTFEDGTYLTAFTQMWGAFELFAAGEELNREYVRDMRTTPIDPDFTLEYFSGLIEELLPGKKRSVKALLTQEQLIPGLGNSVAQDIMFSARLHPKHPLTELTTAQRDDLYHAITGIVQEVIRQGGRYDEEDLFGQPGGYVRLMDKHAVERPCPNCGGQIVKTQYLGGACYLCPTCQQ